MNAMDDLALSRTVVALFKNVVFKETDQEYWEVIQTQKNKIEDYVGKIGLTLIVDELDGYGYLKQRSYGEGEEAIPRLVPRHRLSYPVSLLLVLLRKQLVEFDSTTGDQRLIITRQQIAERLSLFLKDTTNEAKLMADIDKHIDRVEKMGFLHRLRGNEERFEVQRILRNFVTGEWLSHFNERLEEYRRYANAGEQKDGEVEP
ncbi:DUF4194 domain-containing protein [Desulfosporosinus lacus]|uniref:DUF4194 domain-containing protein n=1 Tax=Desulfosporosinus lacus DSM 15449 TaxID=1121420 RepID=A0A1M5X7D7_9FIRM|nr:DUF4194 domain-containing protein [Desulfosporosinus lacus]SHH95709.1 protein of unknown function [Desulfosporosinus lacus DSM 15449]